MDNSRPTWAEIDLAAIRHNLSSIRQRAGRARVMAVVKANAYGHGMLEVSRVCRQEGVDFFGVASLEEALQLRQDGVSCPVLVLGYVAEEYAAVMVREEIRPCIFSLHSARAYSEAAVQQGKTAYLHVKVDTGMGRLGFLPEEKSVKEILAIHRLPGVEVEGIFTHFAEADTDDAEFTLGQLKSFTNVGEKLQSQGVSIPLRHAANSAALMNYPPAHLDLVRAGIILYGLYPSPSIPGKDLDLLPAMTLKSRLGFVKTLPAGHPISYGRTYTCQRDTRVATVPIGYADGYSRLLSNQAWATVKGAKISLIGNVCMDQCMFDVSRVEEAQTGDEIILFGRQEDGITVDDLAEIMGTINYEVVCSIGSRVPRIYVFR